jgi:transcription initiation factor TFIIA large subunit
VIQASQNDFEEFGVDQSTLDEMKTVCDSLASHSAPAPLLRSRQQRAAAAFLRHSFLSFFFVTIRVLSSALRSTMGDAAWLGGDGRP